MRVAGAMRTASSCELTLIFLFPAILPVPLHCVAHQVPENMLRTDSVMPSEIKGSICCALGTVFKVTMEVINTPWLRFVVTT